MLASAGRANDSLPLVHKVTNGARNLPGKYCLNWEEQRDGYVLFDKSFEDALTAQGKNVSSSGKTVHFISGNERKYLEEKLFIRQSALEIIAAYDSDSYYALRSIFVCNLRDTTYSLKYILALLNSTFVSTYARASGIIRYVKGKQPQIRVDGLKRIPVVKAKDQGPYIELVDKILTQIASKNYLQDIEKQKLVKRFQDEIDELVIDLYGLRDIEGVSSVDTLIN
jgi:hypothetical protein